MSIRKQNKRIIITLKPEQIDLLKSIMYIKKCKTYGKAINYIFEAYFIGMDNFLTEIQK